MARDNDVPDLVEVFGRSEDPSLPHERRRGKWRIAPDALEHEDDPDSADQDEVRRVRRGDETLAVDGLTVEFGEQLRRRSRRPE